MTSCLPQKSGGGRGESILDRPPDSLILLSDMVQNENWIYDGEESVASEEDLENEEKEKEENHSPETVAQDPEIIELTTKLSSLNNRKNLDELEDEDDRMARYALHLAKKRRRKKLRSAAYMPNLKSKMYKEWLETQFAKVGYFHFHFQYFCSHYLLHQMFGEGKMMLAHLQRIFHPSLPNKELMMKNTLE